MGWSEQAGQKVHPDYEAEETITVQKNTTLYAVVFNRSSEDNLSADVLPQVNSYKYKNVVFIGDSRTEYMKNALARAGANTNYVKFICKAVEGYSWLTGTAAWTFLDVSQYILGIRPDYDGLIIDPCIPDTMDGFTAKRKFRGNTYHITVRNPAHVQKGVTKLIVDGATIDGNMIPAINGTGHDVTVEVTMG